jgi:hypothetical protein
MLSWKGCEGRKGGSGTSSSSNSNPFSGGSGSSTNEQTKTKTEKADDLVKLIMDTIHQWCREAGVGSMALNASRDAQPLYKSMGYAESPSPMMFLPIVEV